MGNWLPYTRTHPEPAAVAPGLSPEAKGNCDNVIHSIQNTPMTEGDRYGIAMILEGQTNDHAALAQQLHDYIAPRVNKDGLSPDDIKITCGNDSTRDTIFVNVEAVPGRSRIRTGGQEVTPDTR